jgi:uncharacterized protein (TIGR00156 family)
VKKNLFWLCILAWFSAGLAGQSDAAQDIQDISSLRRGQFVAVRGEIVRLMDYDEFRIEDSTGRVDIYLGDRRIPGLTLRTGDTITIYGWVDDDFLEIPKEIYAVEIILEDGSVFTIRESADEDFD